MQLMPAFWDHAEKTIMDKKKELIADFVVKLVCSGGIAVFLGWAGLKIIFEY